MERYKGFNTEQAKGFSTEGIGAATSQMASTTASLGDRLAEFSKGTMEMAYKKAAVEAQDQAAKDDMNNVPFHKQSIYTAYGNAYNDFRTATYTAEAEMDLDAKAREFAMTFENDPEGFRSAYGDYVNTLSRKAPTPDLQAVVGITGRKTMNNVTGKLAVARNTRIREESKVRFTTFADLKVAQAVNALSVGDVKTADLIKSEVATYANTLLNEGILNGADIIKLENGVRYTTSRGTLEQTTRDLIDAGKMDEAQSQYDVFADKIPEGLTVEQHRTILSSLKTIIGGATKAQNAQLKIAKENANADVKDAISVLQSGKTPTNPLDPNTLALASTTNQRAYNVASNVRGILDQYSDYTLQEQEAVLTQYLTTEEGSKIDIEVQKGLKEAVARKRSAWKDDPVTQGAVEGLYKQTLPLDITKPDNIPAILRQREINSKLVKEETGAYDNKLLTKIESQQLTDFFDGQAKIKDKLAILEEINTAGEDTASKIYGQVGGKNAPLLSFAGRILQRGNKKGAELALLGKGADVVLPEKYKQDVSNALVGIYGNSTADYFNETLEGIVSFAKGKALTGEEINNNSDDIQDIIAETVGIVETYNGKKVLIPFGLTEKNFTDWLDKINITGEPELSEELQDLTDVFGSGDIQLHYYDYGQYIIYSPTEEAYISDKQNQPVIIKYKGY